MLEPTHMNLVVGVETFDQFPEAFAVMMVNQMADLVDDDVVDDDVRGHD